MYVNVCHVKVASDDPASERDEREGDDHRYEVTRDGISQLLDGSLKQGTAE